MHSRSQTNVSFLDETREGELQRTFLRRVASMPLVSSTYDMAATAYNSSKNNHPYVKYLCNAAEKGVKTLTEAAVNSAQPILTKLEPQIAAASEYANKSLDTLEGKLPVLQMTADKVACDTKEMVSAKMASAKDAIASKLSGVVNLTKEAVQGSMEATKSAISHSLTSAAATRVGRMAVGGAEAMLGMSEELVDKYLPITDEELAELAETLEDEDVVPQRKQKAYLVRLGSLSNKLRNRAYQHSLAKMKLAGRNIQDSLFQLQQTMNLIEHSKQSVDQKFQEGQEKLSQMWLEWSKTNPDAKQPGCKDVAQLEELSSTLLAQSRWKVLKAQKYMDELLEYVVHNTPLSWMVGPFVLSDKPLAEGVKPDERE
ncbi:perilipin-3-like [Tiliqua scincoides]|uniref:perilipin-3-like n=1 Tax=Tiliqua scincoides TaxID=71010 RepID=UPI003463622D